MTNLLRFLALYDWPEPFDLAQHPTLLSRLVEDARIAPRVITFLARDGQKERRQTIRKNSELVDLLTKPPSYDWISLEESVDGDSRNPTSHLLFESDKRKYVIVKLRSGFNLEDLKRHLQILCEFVTPGYGFSHCEHGVAAVTFPLGIGTSSLDWTTRQRISDLGNSLRAGKEHLAGKLHDVYGFNVLSSAHLARTIEGQTLRNWIGESGRGELLSVRQKVFVWIVPDNIRPAIRAKLFDAGALIARI